MAAKYGVRRFGRKWSCPILLHN